MWKRVIGYGVLLAAGTVVLQWLVYQRLARMHSGDLYLFLVAAAFLVLGIVRQKEPGSFYTRPSHRAK